MTQPVHKTAPRAGRRTAFDRLPLAKPCRNEAQDHSFHGAKDEPCSYKSVLKRAKKPPGRLGGSEGVGTPLSLKNDTDAHAG